MTAAELRPELEALYKALFGIVFGLDMIKGGPPMRQRCCSLDEYSLNLVWAAFNELLAKHGALALSDHDQSYIWTARFSDVLSHLSFQINRRTT